MSNIDTTRKAQFEEWWSKITSAMGDEGLFKVSESNRLMARAGYLAALSTIDPEPVSNQILVMLREERDAYAEENDRLKKSINPDAIRRECADITKIRQGILRVTLNDSWTNEEVAQSVLAAILGTEPAREEAEPRYYWWCSECNQEVDRSRVTFDEYHDACGCKVIAKQVSEREE